MSHETTVEGGTVARRLLEEGFGPGSWHGPNLKAALTDVSPRAAHWRPGPGRHNIAEIAVHHAWCVRAVTTQLSGSPPGMFPLQGEDWFELSDEGDFGWPATTSLVEEQQRLLSDAVSDIGAGRIHSPLSEREQFNLLLGITCHAVYHAGQIQLIKVLGATTAVYYIGSYDIDNVQEFRPYGPRVAALLPKYGGQVLASDTAAYVVEGRGRTMNAIIRFPSKEAALGLYNDPEYQEAKRIRQGSTSNGTMVLVEGVTGL